MLSSSVANAFEYFNLNETTETVAFVTNFDRFFDCFNVRCISESIKARKPDLKPFTSSDDARLKVCSYTY